MDINPPSEARPALGRVAGAQVHARPATPASEVIARFKALGDLTGTVSDVLDELGVDATIPSSTLRPTLDGQVVIGWAVTVRNVPQRFDRANMAREGRSSMAEIEGINQAEPGDVLVIEGIPDVSNMGGIIATICARQQLAGGVVDGGVRDVGRSRGLGFPIWSTARSPVTGKWRAVTAEVNGTVTVCGTTVDAGDLVIADDTGVCFVPRDRVLEVLERCEKATAKEDAWIEEIESGIPMQAITARLYGG
ncbi:RraA family protein [Roseomonas sp. OT10]|uniref:RraA family protein n=1 Tax=Roseomonas cutis TaxID=2897332 RepID=UPI001E287A76|nr:RraA family protein [Roseomonas sp. OT10]UFN49645.1 RraA family protein [Roseomonas sp. OT10]